MDKLFKKKNQLDELIKTEGTIRETQEIGIREETEKIKSLFHTKKETEEAISEKQSEISSLKHQPPMLAMFGNKVIIQYLRTIAINGEA